MEPTDLKKIFDKQGGRLLLRQYMKGGAFFTAVGEYLLLGKSRTALEILRLSAQLKIQQKLKKKYSRLLQFFDEHYDINAIHEKSNKVWVCWFQGIEKAPLLVQKCYQSLSKKLTDREIILITRQNMTEYVTFPDYIIEKWNRGQITHTHMTDLLRLELLIRYGGMWLDATVFCSSEREDIPDYYFDSELFMYQTLKPGRDGHTQLISSWLISAKSNNRILMATRYLCYQYWEKNTEMVDYFLLHDFISIVLEHYPEEWKQIIPQDNATPHIILLRLFDKYDETLWNAVKEQTPFHKLTYKFNEQKTNLPETYYKKLVSE